MSGRDMCICKIKPGRVVSSDVRFKWCTPPDDDGRAVVALHQCGEDEWPTLLMLEWHATGAVWRLHPVGPWEPAKVMEGAVPPMLCVCRVEQYELRRVEA
jgi:hypothetical protein